MAPPSLQDAYLAAFEEHADALFRHARFRISSREQALDLTQETFLRAWDYARSGKRIRTWKGLLYRILDHLIIDAYRKRPAVSLDALAEDEPAAVEALLAQGGRAEEEERLDRELDFTRVQALMEELSYAQRAVITLRYVDGLSPKEIAARLGVSENVVSVRIHRALAELRALLANSP